jgi:serine/threonine protein kinase
MDYKSLRIVRQNANWLVWRGEHPASGDRCLIKQPHPKAADRQRLAARLHEEYQFFKGLDHPRLLRARGWDNTGPRIVFEDMQGNMRQVLAHQQRLPVDLVANVVKQCLDGLGYLHGQRLGHGAVGLQTMLIAPNGQVKFGDFLGYRFDQMSTPPAPEQDVKYQAPELLDSTLGPCSPKSDLYCLGCACLEMLAGPDFEALFVLEHERHAGINWLGWHADPAKTLTNLCEALPYVSQSILKIIEVLIQKDPADRGSRLPRNSPAISIPSA